MQSINLLLQVLDYVRPKAHTMFSCHLLSIFLVLFFLLGGGQWSTFKHACICRITMSILYREGVIGCICISPVMFRRSAY